MGDLRFEVDVVGRRREPEPKGFIRLLRRRPLFWICVALLPIVILLTWWTARRFIVVPDDSMHDPLPAFPTPGVRDGESGERIFETEKVEFKFKNSAPKPPDNQRVVPLPRSKSEKGY